MHYYYENLYYLSTKIHLTYEGGIPAWEKEVGGDKACLVEEDFLKCELTFAKKIPHINAAQDESRKLA